MQVSPTAFVGVRVIGHFGPGDRPVVLAAFGQYPALRRQHMLGANDVRDRGESA